jgi:hypothetical protein
MRCLYRNHLIVPNAMGFPVEPLEPSRRSFATISRSSCVFARLRTLSINYADNELLGAVGG